MRQPIPWWAVGTMVILSVVLFYTTLGPFSDTALVPVPTATVTLTDTPTVMPTLTHTPTNTPTVIPTSTSTSTPVPTRVRVTWYGEDFRGGSLYCGTDIYGRFDPDDPTTVAMGADGPPCGEKLRLCSEAVCIVVVVKDKCGGCGLRWLDLSRAGWLALGQPDHVDMIVLQEPVSGGDLGALPLPANTRVAYGGCASDGMCYPYNFYWAPTWEAVMQDGERQIKVQHELCHAHQHWSINGGGDLAPSDYDLGSWYSSAEGQSFMAAVAGLSFPWTLSAINGLEDFAWTCANWYENPQRLLDVGGQARYDWARTNLP